MPAELLTPRMSAPRSAVTASASLSTSHGPTIAMMATTEMVTAATLIAKLSSAGIARQALLHLLQSAQRFAEMVSTSANISATMVTASMVTVAMRTATLNSIGLALADLLMVQTPAQTSVVMATL